MATQAGSTGTKRMSNINMTPMIDVLLVLLVIFMLAQPLLQRSIDVQIPGQEEMATSPATPIVLEIDSHGNCVINKEPVLIDGLEARLKDIYRQREDKVLYVRAAGELIYGEVIAAMDAARGAGVEVVGAVLPH